MELNGGDIGRKR